MDLKTYVRFFNEAVKRLLKDSANLIMAIIYFVIDLIVVAIGLVTFLAALCSIYLIGLIFWGLTFGF